MTDVVGRLNAALEGRYRIDRELGAGGMATVYLAEDLKHDRKVALKVLKPELAAVLGADRFVVEIKTTASLQHPHILPLFDSGTADGFLFYVMPFIDGETLRDKLDRETQLGIEEAVRITTEIANALDYAHRRGVIHRDIKPENILLHDGRPMVADFGIALAVSAAAGGRMTETGLSLGTPYYMSPEQATADKEISARSDVYSLASVLYEMLTGNPPHVGSSAQQIIMKIVTDAARPVSELRKTVPNNVAAAVDQALQKLPADRFESAAAFAAALKNPAFGAATIRAAGSATRSSRWIPALAGLFLGVVLGGLGVRSLFGSSAPAGEPIREQLTFNGKAQRPAISPDGDFVAYIEITCEHGQAGLCRSSLLVQEVGSTQPRVVIANAIWLGAPRWNHDGRIVVVAGQLDPEREGLFAVARLSGTAQLIGPPGIYDTHPSADSVLLVPFRNRGSLEALIVDLNSGTVADSFALPYAFTDDVAWSPGARLIAAIAGGTLQIVDREGVTTASLTVAGRPTLRWSPDGLSLLLFRVGSVREDEFLRFEVDREGGIRADPEIVMARVPTLYRGEFDIARRTGRMVIGTGDAITDTWSFDLTSGPVVGRRETRGTTWYGDPTLSLDGRLIYYYRGDALGDNVYVLDLATGTEEALTAQRLPGGNAMRLASDGRRLAYGHNSDNGPRLEFIELPSRQIVSESAPIQTGFVVPVASRGFLALTSDGRLALLDSIGAEWKPLPIPDSLEVVSFTASPDGSTAAFVAWAEHSRVASVGIRPVSASVPLAVGLVSLMRDDVRIVSVLDADEPAPNVNWDRDGTLYLGRWLGEDDMPSIWRLAPDGAGLRRVTELPAPCSPSSISVGALGKAAVCSVDDFRSDIWFIDIDGVTR